MTAVKQQIINNRQIKKCLFGLLLTQPTLLRYYYVAYAQVFGVCLEIFVD